MKLFSLHEIPDAIAWAERGQIAIHENYHSRRHQTFHVMSSDRQELTKFSKSIGMSASDIKASENFRFWHLTWRPDQHSDTA